MEYCNVACNIVTHVKWAHYAPALIQYWVIRHWTSECIEHQRRETSLDTEGEANVCKIISDSWHNILSILAIVFKKQTLKIWFFVVKCKICMSSWQGWQAIDTIFTSQAEPLRLETGEKLRVPWALTDWLVSAPDNTPIVCALLSWGC